jgi:hypothetical protein
MKRDHILQSGRAETVADALERLRPEPGDILLFHHAERFRSRVIAWFTRSPFYHVGIYAGNGEVIEARIPQVMRRNLRNQLDGYHFLVVRAPDREAGCRALAWAEKRVGARYDLLSLACLVLSRLLGCRALCRIACAGRFVCGSFVVRAFEAAGVDLFPGRCAGEITPSDFRALLRRQRRGDVFAPSAAGTRSLRSGSTAVA